MLRSPKPNTKIIGYIIPWMFDLLYVSPTQKQFEVPPVTSEKALDGDVWLSSAAASTERKRDRHGEREDNVTQEILH